MAFQKYEFRHIGLFAGNLDVTGPVFAVDVAAVASITKLHGIKFFCYNVNRCIAEISGLNEANGCCLAGNPSL